jgi:hypothetical protein
MVVCNFYDMRNFDESQVCKKFEAQQVRIPASVRRINSSKSGYARGISAQCPAETACGLGYILAIGTPFVS